MKVPAWPLFIEVKYTWNVDPWFGAGTMVYWLALIHKIWPTFMHRTVLVLMYWCLITLAACGTERLSFLWHFILQICSCAVLLQCRKEVQHTLSMLWEWIKQQTVLPNESNVQHKIVIPVHFSMLRVVYRINCNRNETFSPVFFFCPWHLL